LPGEKAKKSKKDKKKGDKKPKNKHLGDTQKSLAESSIFVGTLNQSSSASLPLESSMLISEKQIKQSKLSKHSKG